MNKQPEVLQTTAAIGAICIGVLVYVLDRQAEFVYFLSGWPSFNSAPGGFFGSIGNHLPTFIHVYAFILLTIVVAAPSITKIIPVCLAWFAIDSLFEVAQLNPVAQWIGGHTPIWFGGIPFLDNTADYFLSGTFDMLDLLSIATGALAAYLTIVISTRRA